MPKVTVRDGARRGMQAFFSLDPTQGTYLLCHVTRLCQVFILEGHSDSVYLGQGRCRQASWPEAGTLVFWLVAGPLCPQVSVS